MYDIMTFIYVKDNGIIDIKYIYLHAILNPYIKG